MNFKLWGALGSSRETPKIKIRFLWLREALGRSRGVLGRPSGGLGGDPREPPEAIKKANFDFWSFAGALGRPRESLGMLRV